MQSLQDIHARLLTKKKERRDLKQSFQDELRNNARYMEILEEMEKLRAEKKGIENEIRAREVDAAKLDELKIDIQSDMVLLADVALTMYVQQEPVEITDDMNVRWVPAFSVRFKKS
jgi:predicted nuclease with TOPRIM domain